MTHARAWTPEYIVVGSGAGGGTVAARLAEAGKRVLVFEAGGDPKNLIGGNPARPEENRLPQDYDVPSFHAHACENEAMSWEFFARHYCDEGRQRRDNKYVDTWRGKVVNGVLYPRAGTLGGCTAVNAMITVYPHNADWDYIAQLTGDASWSAENMRRYFERLEACHHRTPFRWLNALGLNPTRHGWNGWLHTEKAIPLSALSDRRLVKTILQSVYKAFRESGAPVQRLKWFLQSQADPNDWSLVKKDAVGVRYTPLATRAHARNGTRERLLATAQRYPNNLRIELNALVSKVLFDKNQRAIGVEYLKGERLYSAHPYPNSGKSEVLRAFASKEVILSGGAFNTPQLLMLSGIGPAATLAQHAIALRVDLPGVGQNLQDRYEVGIVNRMNFASWHILSGAAFNRSDPHYQQWDKSREGVYTTNGAVLAVIKRSVPSRRLPDLFCFALLGYFRGYFPKFSCELEKRPNYLTWAVLKAHTNNRAGKLTIRSSDPRDTPEINFRYFEEGSDKAGADLESVVEGIKFVRRMTADMKREGLIEAEELPGEHVQTDEQLKDFVRDNAWGHHASCTCQIGSREQGGVLSSDFKVHGTTGLRVVDASIFPRIPGFFIVSAVYMVGEKAADAILAEADSLPAAATANAELRGEQSRSAATAVANGFVALEAKGLSLWDTARLQLAVSLPATVWGIVAPNRLGVALLCWLNAGRAASRLFADFRRKYRCDHLWTWFPIRSTLLVLDPESMDAVLRSDHSAPDPSLKKRALSRFAPEGLIISSGEHWEARRRFNEDVLGFNGLHRDGDAFRTIALDEVARLNVQPAGALRWPDFQSLGERISQQVILGARRHEPEMAAQLAQMLRWSNLLLRHRRSFSAFYRTIAHYLSEAPSAERGAGGLDGASHCLVHRSAALLASGAATSATHVPSQAAFWAFVLKDALELHVARTLALIASHPEVQNRVREEIRSVPALTAESIDGLRYLDSCLSEQLRLWTPVPLLLRRADNDLVLRDAIAVKAEQQLLIHAGVYHRDPDAFGDIADRFSPDSADEYPRPVLFFSRHQRSCAGQFLARFLIKATLASLLARFKFKLVNPPIDRQRVPYLYNHFKIELQASSNP